jgi:hypothetical protein
MAETRRPYVYIILVGNPLLKLPSGRGEGGRITFKWFLGK